MICWQGKYLLEDAVVHRNHDDSGDPEAYWTRHHRINLIDDEDALVGILLQPLQMIVRRVPPEEDGRERNESRQKPNVGYHHAHSLFRHVKGILEGSTYREVPASVGGMERSLVNSFLMRVASNTPVDRDTAQMQYARRWKIDI